MFHDIIFACGCKFDDLCLVLLVIVSTMATSCLFRCNNILSVYLMQPTWITQCPLLLLDTRMPYGSLSVGCEERLDPAGTGSLYNEGEADIVVNHVISLIYAGE